MRILAFFWHPSITESTDAFALPGAYRRFINVLSRFSDYSIECDVIENSPQISHRGGQHKVYGYTIPFDEKTFVKKFFYRLFAALMMTLIGIEASRKKRYDLLVAPVGELSCTIIPTYFTHLVTRVPWTAVVQNIPEAYAVVDSSGQLVVSVTKMYKYYRSLGIRVWNALLIACNSFLAKLFLPKIYNETKAIICVSESLGLYLKRLGTRCKIFVAGNGICLDEISKTRTPCVRHYSGIFVGRFVPEKGVFDALEVWRKVTQVFPKARLLLVGSSDKAQMSALKNAIEEFKISENVEALGPVSERKKYALLKSSSLLLFLSRFESFGFIIAEAMACGLPVVCYDMPFVRELFSTSAVLRVPINDINTGALRVCDLMKDDNMRRRLGRKAVQYVKRYLWSEVVRNEAQTYRAILNMSNGERLSVQDLHEA